MHLVKDLEMKSFWISGGYLNTMTDIFVRREDIERRTGKMWCGNIQAKILLMLPQPRNTRSY